MELEKLWNFVLWNPQLSSAACSQDTTPHEPSYGFHRLPLGQIEAVDIWAATRRVDSANNEKSGEEGVRKAKMD